MKAAAPPQRFPIVRPTKVRQGSTAQAWRALAQAKKAQAQWCCESCGQPCRCLGESWSDFVLRVKGRDHRVSAGPAGRYVLTVVRLDQNVAQPTLERLQALCPACRRQHAVALRRARTLMQLEQQGQGNLFDLATPALAGHGKESSRVQLSLRVLPSAVPETIAQGGTECR